MDAPVASGGIPSRTETTIRTKCEDDHDLVLVIRFSGSIMKKKAVSQKTALQQCRDTPLFLGLRDFQAGNGPLQCGFGAGTVYFFLLLEGLGQSFFGPFLGKQSALHIYFLTALR
jgi:hypothetical protein